MSQNDSTPADDAQKEEISLTDPDDYHRKQRLKEIHKARQRVHRVIENFGELDSKPDGKQARRELAYAVSMYITELEPIIHDTGADVSLPDRYPWVGIIQYADSLGHIPDDYDHPTDYAPRRNTVEVFRVCNQVLADVKPLIEDEETTEWEV